MEDEGGKALREYDPSRKGPIKKRSCTDIICCLIFFVFLLGLVAVALYAFAWGDPRLLLYPMDSNGQLCGLGVNQGKSFLFFFDLTVCARMGPGVFVNGCPTPQVCLSVCPDQNYVFAQDLASGDKSNLICQPDVDKSKKSITDLVKDKECAAYYLKSTPVINRCVPAIDDLLNVGNSVLTVVTSKGPQNVTGSNNETVQANVMKNALKKFKGFLQAKEYAEKVIADVQTSWYLMLIALCITMVLSLLWIGVMRWIAGLMVWLAIFLFISLFGAATILCFYQYSQTKGSGASYTIYLGIEMTFSQEKGYLAGGIIAGGVFVIVVLILLFLCNRIRLAIQLIKEGSKAIGNMLFTLLWPVFPFILQIGVIILFLTIAIWLFSVGRAQNLAKNNVTLSNGTTDYDEVKNDVQDLFQKIPCENNQNNDTLSDICGVLKYGDTNYILVLQVYNLFMLFWLVNFVIALGNVTLAGAFASYYWAFDKSKDIPTFPLLSSFWRAIRYHLGSIAFGSLIIAIVQLIRVFLEYIDAKLKGSENAVAKFFIKCLKCCFWCLEKFLKFLSKNAYILIAVYGKNFCVSAKDAFSLILRNCIRVVVVDKVTDFLLFVSKLVIVGAVGVGTYFFFDGRISFLRQYQPTLNYYLVPIVITILGAFIITSAFFSVYEMAVDTLFLCFLTDLEHNDGSAEKPYFMSKALMKLLGKKNKKPADQTGDKGK